MANGGKQLHCGNIGEKGKVKGESERGNAVYKNAAMALPQNYKGNYESNTNTLSASAVFVLTALAV